MVTHGQVGGSLYGLLGRAYGPELPAILIADRVLSLHLGKWMRRKQTCLLVYTVLALVALPVSAQSATNPIVIDYISIPESQPELVDSLELAEYEDVYGPWSIGNGTSYFSIHNYAADTMTLLKYNEDGFSPRLATHPDYVMGPLFVNHSLYAFSAELFINRTVIMLIQIDPAGNFITVRNATIEGGLFWFRTVVGRDGAVYLLGELSSPYFDNEAHLLKVFLNGTITWNHKLPGYVSDYDMSILQDGNLFLVNMTHLERRDSNGEPVWLRELPEGRYGEKVLAYGDSSVVVKSCHFSDPSGYSIYRYNLTGNLLANTTLLGRSPTGSEAGIGADVFVEGGIIYALVGFDTTMKNPYLIELSGNLDLVSSSSLYVNGLRFSQLGFASDHSPLRFGVRETDEGDVFCAYSFSETSEDPTSTNLLLAAAFSGGCIGAGVLILYWFRRRSGR
jgi:hypothetical protein